MGSELLVPLVGLALVDSTSFGTLLVPLWLMLAPGRLRPGRIVLYLATVAVFYWCSGAVLALGAVNVLEELGGALDSLPGRITQGVAGVVLMMLGVTVEPWTKAGKEARRAKRAAREATRGPGRLSRLRARASGDVGSAGAVVTLAVSAAGLETVSMVPYLAALGLLSTSGQPLGAVTAVLGGYCLVMVAPALALLGIRWALRQRLTASLQRLEGWLTRNAGEALAWVLFLLGLYLLKTALL